VANHGADTCTVPSVTYNKLGSSESGEVTKNTSTDTGTSSTCTSTIGASTGKEDPPLYGSQEYWEKRYSVLKPPGHRGRFELDGTQDDVEVNALPGHAWYFTYDELRPLILPLLLGRDVSPAAFFTEGEDDDGEYETAEEEEEEQVNDGDVYDGEKEGRENGQEDHKDEEAETKPTCIIGTTTHEGEQDKNEAGEGNGSVPCGHDTIGKDQPPHPPKSVLEIGCGDVPLGYSLFLDLLSMEKETQADASLVVSRIVCNDYAKMVVDILRDRQRKRWLASGIKGSYEIVDGRDGMKIENVVVDSDSLNPSQEHDRGAIVPKLDVSYVVEDARKMAHSDESFDLVIDKGTLDALLSDKDMGIKNCVDVVSEMGRVLRVGGYIMIISHMNANIQSGLEWCDEVVVAGLRASGADAFWEIEIHGNDGNNNDCDDDYHESDEDAVDITVEDGEEAANSDGNVQSAEHDGKEEEEEVEEDADIGTTDKGPPSGSPGPACYIIHKMPPQKQTTKDSSGSGTGVQMMIPLKFYTY